MSTTRIVSSHTRRILKSKGIRIMEDRSRAERTREKLVHVYGNNNLLEYNMFVIDYITKKFQVSRRDVDFLCFLYPREVFSMSDFRSWPMTYTGASLKRLEKIGLLSRFSEVRKQAVYALSPKGKQIVTLYHRYLLDFSAMPKISTTPQYHSSKSSGYGRQLSKLIEALQPEATT